MDWNASSVHLGAMCTYSNYPQWSSVIYRQTCLGFRSHVICCPAPSQRSNTMTGAAATIYLKSQLEKGTMYLGKELSLLQKLVSKLEVCEYGAGKRFISIKSGC